MKLPEDVRDFFVKQGAKGGKKGAAARMKKTTAAQRKAAAKKAVEARWAKRKD